MWTTEGIAVWITEDLYKLNISCIAYVVLDIWHEALLQEVIFSL